MNKHGTQMLASPEFKHLVRRKWTMSILLTGLLFVLYYGYILLVAWDKPLLAKPVFAGGVTTLGIVLGVGVIVGAWVLTAAYVMWANRVYDVEVERLKGELVHVREAEDRATSQSGH